MAISAQPSMAGGAKQVYVKCNPINRNGLYVRIIGINQNGQVSTYTAAPDGYAAVWTQNWWWQDGSYINLLITHDWGSTWISKGQQQLGGSHPDSFNYPNTFAINYIDCS